MVKQYFTYREIPSDKGFIGPDQILRECFKGLDFKFKLAIIDCKNDSRKLGLLEVKEKDHISPIIKILSMFGVKEKNIEEARDFYKYASGIELKIIDGDLDLKEPTIEDEQKEYDEMKRRLKDELR